MASEKQIREWTEYAKKINPNPRYVELYIDYKKKAIKADRRLANIEAYSHDKHFEGIKTYAYKRAIHDIQSWGGNKRFNTKPPKTITELEAKISDVEDFLKKPTSTKAGVLEMYKKRAQTLTDKYGAKYGIKFTWQEVATFFERAEALGIDVKKASKTLIRALALMKLVVTQAKLQDIKDTAEAISHVEGASNVVKSRAKKLLKMGLTYDDLMGGNEET